MRCFERRRVIWRFQFPVLLVVLSLLIRPAHSQAASRDSQPHDWDISVWVAAETGEELLNNFSEAQILTAGVFAGKILTDEVGRSWRKGRFEYGMDLIPLLRQFRPEPLYGVGVEPVILRWNSSLHAGRVSPYIELAGGGVRTNVNLPAGNTSDFNFTARGGGGILISRTPRHAVDVGVRWSHISNANLGVDNPEFNGIQVSVGYHWFK